jgi:hypothetical protein
MELKESRTELELIKKSLTVALTELEKSKADLMMISNSLNRLEKKYKVIKVVLVVAVPVAFLLGGGLGIYAGQSLLQ